jgi:hypothetical protein
MCIVQLVQPINCTGILLQQSDVAAEALGFAAIGNASISEISEQEPADRFSKIIMLQVRIHLSEVQSQISFSKLFVGQTSLFRQISVDVSESW